MSLKDLRGLLRPDQVVPDDKARMLTSVELFDCCGGCRTNSAIETWMRRAIVKFCEVNGIALSDGVPPTGENHG